MDRVWNTSKYHPMLFVSAFKVKVHPRPRVRTCSSLEFCVLVVSNIFLVGFALRTQKYTSTFIHGQIKAKFANRKIQKAMQ